MKIKISVFLLVISLFTACIEEYSPKIDGYKDILVIDGVITNEPGPYIIRLSRTLAVDDLDYFPITGANIVISDDLDVQETLIEFEPGVYATNPSGIRGEVGRKYRITIDIGDETYQSSFEELKQPYEIDSVYSKIEYKETLDGAIEGLQFYVNTEEPNNQDRQILWTLTETYKYRPELVVEYLYYYYQDSLAKVVSDTVNIGTEYSPIYVTINNECWKTKPVSDIYLYSTKNFTDSKISNFSLNYVSSETKKLSEKYSLMINQYSITESAYNYWNEIKKQNAESSSLYTSQPYQIKGNLININNPNDIILGYFMAAGLSKKRIFVDRPQLTFISNCVSSRDYFITLINLPIPPRVIFITTSNPSAMNRESAFFSCLDCQEQGGTTTKPDFWED